MPASGNGYGQVYGDLVDWQHRAQHEPVEHLAALAGDDLNLLAETLDALNELLREPPCECGCTQEAIVDAAMEVLKLGTSAAIAVLGLTRRNPGGVSFVPASSPN
jgi:hypothetical protein